MSAVVLAALLAQALSDPPLVEDKDRSPLVADPTIEPAAEEEPAPGFPEALPLAPVARQSQVTTAKGGTHLIGIGGVIGTGAAIVALAGAFINPSTRDFSPSGAAAAGLFALFLGGGLAGARLLEPTPPAAWGSFWAGTAGAMLGFKLAIDVSAPLEGVLAAGAIGYVAAAGLYLVLPDAGTLSWKEFWVTLLPGAFFTGLAAALAITGNLRDAGFTLAMAFTPVTAMLVSRVIFAFWQPFDPWVDDLKGPFRAQPIIAFSPTGASVGIAASW